MNRDQYERKASQYRALQGRTSQDGLPTSTDTGKDGRHQPEPAADRCTPQSRISQNQAS